MSFREWVPDWCRFWVYMLFLAAFQFSNGMYFTAMSQMQGEHSLTMNDVKMMSHAVLIGLTVFFPLAFRLKFRFTNRTCIMTAAAVLLLCNIVVPHIDNPFLLVCLGVVAGFFRLFGTFECFSSVLPKITPTYNYAVFLSFVFFVVLGVIHVFDAVSIHIIYYYDWQHLHLIAVGLLLVVLLLAYVLMRPFRSMPMMPLFGVDWLGMMLWVIFILSLIFVAQYGIQLDWLSSPYIRTAIGVACISLAFNIARMTYIRHPFIEAAAFRVGNLANLLVAFLCLAILLSSKNMLQNVFTGSVLHNGPLHTSTLKMFEFAGSLLGALFSWITLALLRWPHKRVAFIGFGMVAAYVAQMCAIVSPAANIEKLYLPLMCCGFGHLLIFIALTVYLQATAPFKNYFQVLCILGFVRTGIGSPIGDALYQHGLSMMTAKHMAAIGSAMNSGLADMQAGVASIPASALVSAIRDLYAYTFVFAVGVMVMMALSRYRRNVKKPVPKLRFMYRQMTSRMRQKQTMPQTHA